MFRSDAVTVPAGLEHASALAEVMALLDPHEVAEVRFIALGDNEPVGMYLITFNTEQIFDPEVFTAETWEQIEDASEQIGLIEAHLAAA